MKEKYYLAYGSNLNLDQMEYRCPSAVTVGYTMLKGYRLIFRGSHSGSYLTIERCAGSTVPVGVWKITDEDERFLDRYEGYPNFYHKKMIPVHVISYFQDWDMDTVAMVYIMNKDRPVGIPTSDYLLTCRQGYIDWGFDTKYLMDALAASRKEAKTA